MRQTLLIFATTLALVASLRAQEIGNDTLHGRLAALSLDSLPGPAGSPGKDMVERAVADPPAPRIYGGMEYLLWWVKGAPLSVPLVSTGPIATTHHGLLGPPAEDGADSTVLYGAGHSPATGGNDTQNFSAFSGGRITMGYWLDDKRRFAIEASGFMLESHSAGYATSGDKNGNPVLGIPVHNSTSYVIGTMTIFDGEDSLPFALPKDANRARGDDGIISGNIKISNSLRLWGTGLNSVLTLYQTPSFELAGLAGLRYLDLSENFNLKITIAGQTGRYAGQFGVATDDFHTRNHFYGTNLGLRGRKTFGPVSVELTAVAALGVSHEVLNIAGGFYSYNFTASYSHGPEGVFAQPANEGKSSQDKFAVVPEAQLKLGYALTPRLTATAGYDFIFYSNVLRPTDQIDRNIPKGQTFNQSDPTISTTSPSRFYRTTSFWAHGLSFGLEYSF